MLNNSLLWVFSGLFIGVLFFSRYFCNRRAEAIRRQFEVEAREERLKAKEERSSLELAYKDREAELERAIMGSKP